MLGKLMTKKSQAGKVRIMSNNTDSQCYFVQLQIDGFLDGDLSQAQQDVFMSHVHSCEACAHEFHYAQTVQDTVLELPLVDCQEHVLEPIHRLSNSEAKAHGTSWFAQLQDLFATAPGLIRYGFPVATTAVLAVAISLTVLRPAGVESIDNEQIALEPVEQYSPQDIAQALSELNVAIDYLNQMSLRTEVMIEERFILNPIQDSLNASFEKARIRNVDPLQNDPI